MSESESSHQPIDPENKLSDADYNNRRRLEAINDARDRVSEILLDVERELMLGKVDRYRASWAVHAAVKVFIRESQWVLANHSKGDFYYYEKEIGSFGLPHRRANLATNIPYTKVESGRVTFQGLYSVLECPREVEAVWIKNKDSHLSGKQQVQQSQKMTVPMRISMHAYDVLVNLLGESDMNLTFDGERSLGAVSPDFGEI